MLLMDETGRPHNGRNILDRARKMIIGNIKQGVFDVKEVIKFKDEGSLIAPAFNLVVKGANAKIENIRIPISAKNSNMLTTFDNNRDEYKITLSELIELRDSLASISTLYSNEEIYTNNGFDSTLNVHYDYDRQTREAINIKEENGLPQNLPTKFDIVSELTDKFNDRGFVIEGEVNFSSHGYYFTFDYTYHHGDKEMYLKENTLKFLNKDIEKGLTPEELIISDLLINTIKNMSLLNFKALLIKTGNKVL